METILQQLDALGVKFQLCRSGNSYYSSPETRWFCSIALENKKGDKVEIDRRGLDAESVLREAKEAFDRVVGRGLDLPQIGHVVEHEPELGRSLDDEIPF